MALIRPRFTDHLGIACSQADVDYAIPFLDEDIPLYVDPFLLWKSPSYQDKSLHNAILNSFNHLGHLVSKGKEAEARDQLIVASECNEVGLGVSALRRGKRIGKAKADRLLTLFRQVPQYQKHGFTHFEEIQFYIDGISQDRISDFSCSLMKSFLIDFTIDQCAQGGLPITDTSIPHLYNLDKMGFDSDVPVSLPVHPETRVPILLVPKRWLRFSPWINFDDYFKHHCPRDDIFNPSEPLDRVRVLNFNRDNYGVVEQYVREKERTGTDCRNDPLFSQIPVLSAKRKLKTIQTLKTGKEDNADRKYEDYVCELMATLMYPNLDFAQDQSRTDSGVLIRDLIFYNTRRDEFLDQICREYGSQQIVMELKNVAEIDRDHINQLNRYMTDELGRFGVLITRNELKRARQKSTIDLWAGQRRCIITLTDIDLEQMVDVYESKQRSPLDVLKKKYVQFRRDCPS